MASESKTPNIDSFSEYFSGSTLAIDEKKMTKFKIDNVEKTLIGMSVDVILSKYPEDSVISFDPTARTMMLMLFHFITMSANAGGFTFKEAAINTYPKKFDIGTNEKNIWTWISELVASADGWDTVENIEVPQHMDEVIKMYETVYKVNIQSAILAQVLFILILDKMGDILYKLSPITTYNSKGMIIAQPSKPGLVTLAGLFRVIAGNTTNPEIFEVLTKAAEEFPVAKKIFVEKDKIEKKRLKTETDFKSVP
jgi:hypothetical protein